MTGKVLSGTLFDGALFDGALFGRGLFGRGLFRGRGGARRWAVPVVAFLVGVATTGAFLSVPRSARYHHGCGRDPSDDDTIVMVSGEDINPKRQRQELIAKWNLNHTPKARLIEIPGGADQEQSEMLAEQQLGSCAYDVLSLDVVWAPAFIRAGYLAPFPAGEIGSPAASSPGRPYFDPAAFLAEPWRIGTAGGRQYTIPFHTDVGLLYYRKDLVPGPPRTWDELRLSADRYSGRKGLPEAGLVTQLADYEGLTVNGMEAVWRVGGTIEERNGRVVVDQAAARGLAELADGMRTSASHELILGASAGYREADTITAFADGKTLFLRNWPYAYPVLAADPAMRDRFEVAQLPGPAPGTPGPGALGGQELGIPRNSPHQEAARELIQFLTEPDQQRELFACGGYVPVLKAAYDDIRSCSELPGQPQPPSGEADDELSRAQLRHLAGILEAALTRARVRPNIGYYPAFSRAFRGYLYDAIISGKVIDAAGLSTRLTPCAGDRSPNHDCP